MANSDLIKYISTIQNLSRKRRHKIEERKEDMIRKTIQNANARPEIPLFHTLTHQRVCLLDMPGSDVGSMDAH